MEIENVKVCSKKEIDPDLIYKPKEEIVDLNDVVKQIIEILEFMNTKEMIEMKQIDQKLFEKFIDDKFSDFSLMYHSILRLLFENNEQNIQKLMYIIQILGKVKNKELNMDNVFEDFKESLAEEYIYPEFGGKSEFEQTIIDRNKKKEKKQFKKSQQRK